MFFAASRKLIPLALFSLALAVPAQDTPPSHERIEQLMHSLNRGHSVGQVAVSPDGKRLAWIDGMRGGGEIRVAPVHDLAKSERITAATTPEQHCREGQLSWAPDSAALAFLSDCADAGEQSDLYLWRWDGNGARRVTQLIGYANQPEFSPDGEAIAFLYVKGGTRPAGALAAMKSPAGVIGEDGVEIERVAVTRLDVAAPNALEVTPANLHVYEFDWAPDSKSLAFVAADPPGENNWWTAKLYTQEVAGAPKAILDPQTVSGALHGLQIAVPRWSPDGKTIAFIGGLMSDQGATGGDVFTIPANGGEPHNLTPGRSSSASWIEWAGNQHIFVSEIAGGNSRLIRLALDGDIFAARLQLPRFHRRRYARTLAFRRRPTAPTSSFMPAASTAPTKSTMHRRQTRPVWRSSPTSMQTLNPQSSRPGANPPLLNGPATPSTCRDGCCSRRTTTRPKSTPSSSKSTVAPPLRSFPGGAAAGLSVPLPFPPSATSSSKPNPRGSYGQGEAFTQANRKDFGYGDLRDILAGVDTVLAKYPVDPNRVGLTGWSYGGFMTMFAVTQTHRFKAAVAGAGISDWLSYYGENSIDQWMIPYFGASVYDDPAVYAKSSAINYIKRATTPTLSVVGDRDGECPAPQSFEFWHALHDLHVPASLVVYPNEGHGFVDPAHNLDVLERALDWFARYMPPAG